MAHPPPRPSSACRLRRTQCTGCQPTSLGASRLRYREAAERLGNRANEPRSSVCPTFSPGTRPCVRQETEAARSRLCVRRGSEDSRPAARRCRIARCLWSGQASGRSGPQLQRRPVARAPRLLATDTRGYAKPAEVAPRVGDRCAPPRFRSALRRCPAGDDARPCAGNARGAFEACWVYRAGSALQTGSSLRIPASVSDVVSWVGNA